MSAEDARLARLDIAKVGTSNYQDLEIGLIYLQRAHQLLKKGGKLGNSAAGNLFLLDELPFLVRLDEGPT